MSTTRTKPDSYTNDGLPIYYTISKEKAGDKLNMTARLPKIPTKRSPLPYGRIVYQSVHTVPSGSTLAKIQATLAQHAPSFWVEAFTPQKDPMSFRNQWIKDSTPEDGLPLAIVVAIHSATFEATYAEGTKKKKRIILDKLCESPLRTSHIATDQLFKITDFLNDPTVFSSSKLTQGVALLRWFCQLECFYGRLSYNPWLGITLTKKPAHRVASLFNQAIRDNVYSQHEIERILTFASEHLSPSVSNRKFLGLLLVTSMGIPLDELCCVTMADITCKKDTPISIAITKVLKVVKKNQKEIHYNQDSAKYRILPIPPNIATLLTPLVTAWRKADPTNYKNRYLLPYTHNNLRHGDPKVIQKWINQTISNMLDIRLMFTESGKKVSPSSLLPPYSRLFYTIKNALAYQGFEPDEINYYFGYTQKSTAGKTYCDFGNEAQLRRMALILNSRIPAPFSTTLTTAATNPSRYTTLSLESDNLCPAGTFTLSFPPLDKTLIPERGFTIDLSAYDGMSLIIDFN